MDNKGQIAGILSIVSGAIGLLGGAYYIAMMFFMNIVFDFVAEVESAPPPMGMDSMMDFMFFIYGAIGLVFVLIGILAIIGGVYSIKRKYWGLGLAGAIGSTVVFYPCGIAAIILIAIGKSEFNRQAAVPPLTQSQPMS
jgi:hypothetical protein